MGKAAGISCKYFPIAYTAFKRYGSVLSFIPGLGGLMPVILAALTAVNTTVVPVVCKASAPPAPPSQ